MAAVGCRCAVASPIAAPIAAPNLARIRLAVPTRTGPLPCRPGGRVPPQSTPAFESCGRRFIQAAMEDASIFAASRSGRVMAGTCPVPSAPSSACWRCHATPRRRVPRTHRARIQHLAQRCTCNGPANPNGGCRLAAVRNRPCRGGSTRLSAAGGCPTPASGAVPAYPMRCARRQPHSARRERGAGSGEAREPIAHAAAHGWPFGPAVMRP